jgi:hypothetical protein
MFNVAYLFDALVNGINDFLAAKESEEQRYKASGVERLDF